MANFKDIIKLLQEEQGKTFIMDDSGEVKLVIMGIVDYKRLQGGKTAEVTDDSEAINRRIMEAQLSDDQPKRPQRQSSNEVGISSAKPQRVDLRSEVMDPNFDYSTSTSEDDEAIKTDFDDI